MFLDFSSAFSTIIPQKLIQKLILLGLNTSLYNWLLDFLNGNTSRIITLNTGCPQGCALGPLLFTLLTHDHTPMHSSYLSFKFSDDTTMVGLLNNGDKTNYRSELSSLAT